MKTMKTLTLTLIAAAGLGLTAASAKAENFAESRTFAQGYVKDEGAYMRTMLGESKTEQVTHASPLAVTDDGRERRIGGLGDQNGDGLIDFFYDEGRYMESMPK